MGDPLSNKIICRTCKSNCCQYLHLTEEAVSGKCFAEILLIIANINANYELPNHICNDCAMELKRAYEFVQRAQKVNRELMEHLKMDCLLEAPIDVPIENATEMLKIKTEPEYAINQIKVETNVADVERQLEMPDWSQDATDVASDDQDDDFDPMMVMSLEMTKDASSDDDSSDEDNEVLAVRLRKRRKQTAGKMPKKPKTTVTEQKTVDEQDKKQFTCEICQISYTWRKSLYRHTKLVHKEHTEFTCDYCDRRFLRKDKYSEHMKMHMNRRPRFESWRFAERLCTNTRFKLIECKLCDATFESNQELRNHLLTHAQLNTLEQLTHKNSVLQQFYPKDNDWKLPQIKTQIIADIEQQLFDRYYNIVNEYGYEMCLSDSDQDDAAHAQKYQCELCQQSFMRKHQLLMHAKVYHDGHNVPYECTFCRVKFVNQSLYESHLRHNCHNKLKKHRCTQCMGKFMWQRNLLEHLCLNPKKHTTTSVRSELACCYSCNKTFTWEKDLLRHLKNHKAVEVDENLCKPNGCKFIECMICQSKHIKISDLRSHLRTHEQQLQFTQNISELSLQLYPELESMSAEELHKRISNDMATQNCMRFYSITNEMGYELSLTASETASDNSDEDDITVAAVKTEAFDYVCDLCGTSFQRKYQIFAHQAEQHKWSEAEHVCANCNARFVNEKLLSWHQRQHCRNPLKKHQCKRCPRRFMWKKNLKLHLQIVHDLEMDSERKEEISTQPKQTSHKPDTATTQTMNRVELENFLVSQKSLNLIIHCHWCPRKFSRKHHLYLHLQKHNVTSEQYENMDSIIRATTNANGYKQIQCKICDGNFRSINDLRQHFALQHVDHNVNVLSNYCITNQLGFEMLIDDSETEAEAEEDATEVRNTYKYTCQLCGLTSKRKYQMAQHQLQAHQYEDLPFKCYACVYSTVCQHLLTHHMQTQCGTEKQFDCSICYYKFMWQENVRNHIQLVHVANHSSPASMDAIVHDLSNADAATAAASTDNDKKVFKCKYCHCTYGNKKRLSAHLRAKHSSIAADIKQENPSNATLSMFATRKHTNTTQTAATKTHLCSFCGLSFLSSSVLNVHVRRHTGEKPFKCDLCEMAFIRSSDLRIHKRKHTGERPFKCTMCDKAFVTLYKLQIHFRTHTGDRPYKCTVCEKSFYQANDLTVHVRVHTNERPYKCNLCEKSFKRSSGYTDHMRRHANSVRKDGFSADLLLGSHLLNQEHMYPYTN